MRKKLLKILVIFLFLSWVKCFFFFSKVFAFTPWNFAILNDTHAVEDQSLFEVIYSLIAAQNPKIIFHLGDTTWGTDINRYSLKGIFDLRGNSSHPLEIHLAPGNHDNLPDGCGPLKIEYQNFFCSLNSPFNLEAKKYLSWCKPDSVFRQYVFMRGGIKFIMLDLPFYCESKRGSVSKEWFRQQICQNDASSISIAFLHESQGQDYVDIKGFLDSLPCGSNHNLKAIFMGHAHHFKYEVYKGVYLITATGVWKTPWADSIGFPNENDFWYAKVNQTKIDFYRTRWDCSRSYPDSPQLVFSLNGNFSDYIHPSSDPCYVDVNLDKKVNFTDLSKLLENWNKYNTPFEYLLLIINNFNKNC